MNTRLLIAAELLPAGLPFPFSLPQEQQFLERVHQYVKSLGDDCHTLRNLWVVETATSLEEIKSRLYDLEPHGKFIIVLFSGPWQAVRAKSEDDCYKKR